MCNHAVLHFVFHTNGKGQNYYKLDDMIHFGNRQMGVLFSYINRQAAVSYTGIKAAVILFVFTFFFIFLTLKQSLNCPMIDLSWTIIWGILLTLLIFRLIEAYRLSLLPPMDASAVELKVFHKSLTTSFLSFILIPAGLLFIRLISQKRVMIMDWLEGTCSWSIVAYLVILVPVGAAIAVKLLAKNETLLETRTNILVHIIMIVTLTLSARSLVDSNRKRFFFFISFLLTFSFMIFLVKDAGFMVYGISLGITLTFLLSWDLSGRRKKIVLLTLFLIPVVCFILWYGFPGLLHQAARLIPRETHWHYRVVENQEAFEKLLLDDSRKNRVNMRLLLRNMHQRWQMLLYAAEGARQPKGFGKAALVDKGMTYPTTLTDCFYSNLVLSEFGTKTGTLLIVLFFISGIQADFFP